MNPDEKLLQILDNSACLRKEQMVGYLRGDLYPEELRVVELHLSECGLCNDALEGLQTIEQLNAVIDRIPFPELPYSAPAEKKIIAASEPVSKKPEVKISTTERASAYTSPKLSKPRNYSWVGGVGIAALLLLGSALIWQFELKNKVTEPVLADKGIHQIPLPDSVPAKEPDSTTRRIAATTPKNENPGKQDSAYIAFAAKQDSVGINGKAVTAAQKTSSKKDSGIVLPAISNGGKDSGEQPLALSAKQELKTQELKASDKDVKPAKPGSAPSNQPAISTTSSGEGSDFETGVRLFKQKKYASALLYLKSAESDKDHPSHWDAVYYSALCNKYLGKTGRAKRLFKRIVNAGAPQKSAAEKQLEELSRAKEE